MAKPWVPGDEGDLQEFVDHLHRRIGEFVDRVGADQASVQVELDDGRRFAVATIVSDPGRGFITLVPHPDDTRESPEEVIVPLSAIRRIELDRTAERTPFGFTLPG